MIGWIKYIIAGWVMLFSALSFGQFSNQEALKLALAMDKVSRFYVDSIDNGAVVEDAIEHMLHELDPHSSYISKEEIQQMNEEMDGEFEGIGVSFNVLKDTIYIIRAISGGPSERVGIRAGDRIVKVEGENVAGIGITSRDVQRKLKGPKGTEVSVHVHRRGISQELEFTITRDKIPVNSMDAAYMVNKRVGYIKLARFAQTTLNEFETAVESLKDQGMEDLILDLSGNGGGWLQAAVDLSDHFISGTREIVSTSGDKVPPRKYRARRAGLFEEGRLVIMIDGTSASSSEIVSGAVQDWDRGHIVGRRSFGKGLVQQVFPLGDGSMMRLTVARYFTPTGRLIQKPYDDGYEAYTMDLIDRYNRGELNSQDSIEFPESQRYQTLRLKRTVYGGGGIMPDYFVPIDTSDYSDYYRLLIGKGLFNRFVLDYVDGNRDELLREYPDFDDFQERFEADEQLLASLTDYAGKEGLEFVEADWEVSKDQVAHLMKAFLARDLWEMDRFYQVYNQRNNIFLKALSIMEEESALQE